MAITVDNDTVLEDELEVKPEEHLEEKSEAADENEDAEEGEVTVSLGGAPSTEEDEADTPLIKDLRNRIKETNRKLRETEERLAKTDNSVKAIEVGPKPTLENCNYDEAEYDKQLTDWHGKKAQADVEAQNKAKEAEKVEEAWKLKQQNYKTAQGNLKVKDFAEAEEAVKAAFSITQQGIIVQGAKDAAVIVYALGKYPAEANRLAAIKDPIEFAFEVARLEGKLKVSTKKAPLPEKKPNSSGGASLKGGTDKTLERLRAEAEKTGNYTEVIRYKNGLRQAK